LHALGGGAQGVEQVRRLHLKEGDKTFTEGKRDVTLHKKKRKKDALVGGEDGGEMDYCGDCYAQ